MSCRGWFLAKRSAAVSLGALGLAIHATSIAAQPPGSGARVAVVSRPIAPPPDSVPTLRASLAKETTPRAIVGLQRSLPTVIPGEKNLVVASTTWSHDWAAARDSGRADLVRCGTTLGVPLDTMRAFLGQRPWRAFDDEVSSAPYVLFQAMPHDAPTAACALPRLNDPRYLQSGLALTTASLLGRGTNVSDVDVFADERFQSPTIYGRVPVVATEWFRSPDVPLARTPTVGQVRVYLPMEALDPQHGRFPAITLRVWNDYLKLATLAVPARTSRQLWYELVPWRLEHLRNAVPTGVAPVPALPTPNDSLLRTAVDRYRRGDVVDAAEVAAAWRTLDRSRTGGVDTTHNAPLRRDRLIADVMIGGTLAAAGDTVAAVPFADNALVTAPCLVPTSPTFARVVANRRPTVRCTGLSPTSVMRHGLSFPGGGHAFAGDHGLAAGAIAAVGLTLGGAVVATLVAAQHYDDYKQATTVESASGRYADAVSMRNLGIGLVAGSAAIWLGDTWYAVMREKHRTARIRAEASFGRPCGRSTARECAR